MKKNRIISGLVAAAVLVLLCGCGQEETITYSVADTSREAGSEKQTVSVEEKTSTVIAGTENQTVNETDSGASGGSAVQETDQNLQTEETKNAEIYVYVCGAVRVPGVYPLPEGSRAYQAIAAAGGMKEDAYERSLNQAQMLSDGQQITIFTKEEAEKLGLDQKAADVVSAAANVSDADQAGAGKENASEIPGVQKVNLNSATKEELMTIPGVGEAKAAAIIQYREENGNFSNIEEVQNISGIKAKAFSKMKDYIEV